MSEFSVVEFYDNGTLAYVERWLDAESAVRFAKHCTDAAATLDGLVTKVIITDGGDDTVFQWERGKGMVFPAEELDARYERTQRQWAELEARYDRINRMWTEADMPLVRQTPNWEDCCRVLGNWFAHRQGLPEPTEPFRSRALTPMTWAEEVHIFSHMLEMGHNIEHAMIEEEGARIVLEWWSKCQLCGRGKV